MKNSVLFSIFVTASICSANAFASKLCGGINSRAKSATSSVLEVVEDSDDNERVYVIEGASSQQMTEMQAIDSQNQFFCLHGSYNKNVHTDANGDVDGSFTVDVGSSVIEQTE